MLEVPQGELPRIHLNTGEGITSLCYAYKRLGVVFHLDTSIVLKMSRLVPDRLNVINGFLCSTAASLFLGRNEHASIYSFHIGH